ncbi:hypothetical protein RKE29_01005 [Streptomyces sp. B1866]|uniref:hypothetical protein n=1 Tax=Streptomyces sp. B1866 TaxID=3075431 RepID=UPI0028911D7E|nr:hypothetical protein [Streptomyces sp. B1866]MDT3395240.1 hypothetical protein [Streptomyces sp. B1866]
MRAVTGGMPWWRLELHTEGHDGEEVKEDFPAEDAAELRPAEDEDGGREHTLLASCLPTRTAYDVEARAAGEQWDAVRVPLDVGERALSLLGKASGAVLLDGASRSLYWLISPGTAKAWNTNDLPGVAIRGRGFWVAVPPWRWGADRLLGWRVRPVRGRVLTAQQELHSALLSGVRDLAAVSAVAR